MLPASTALLTGGTVLLAIGFPARNIWMVLLGTILDGAGFAFTNPVQIAAHNQTPLEQRGMVALMGNELASNAGRAMQRPSRRHRSPRWPPPPAAKFSRSHLLEVSPRGISARLHAPSSSHKMRADCRSPAYLARSAQAWPRVSRSRTITAWR
jgi:hypothetical protein